MVDLYMDSIDMIDFEYSNDTYLVSLFLDI